MEDPKWTKHRISDRSETIMHGVVVTTAKVSLLVAKQEQHEFDEIMLNILGRMLGTLAETSKTSVREMGERLISITEGLNQVAKTENKNYD